MQKKAKSCVRSTGRKPATTSEQKGASFYEKWKKLLACLLAGLMALAVFTACDGSAGVPIGPKHSDASSAKALCEQLGMTYSEELSDKAYSIANWVSATSVSCSANTNKTELYRVGNANDIAKTSLLQRNYATAFESIGMGILGANDFVPGFYIDTDLDSRKDYISFTLPKDGIVTDTMKSAAVGKTKLGVAYVVNEGVRYAVVLLG